MSLINKSELKKYILAKIEATRFGWDATRVAGNVAEKVEATLKVLIDNHVHSHPTMGKTFYWE